MGITRREWLKTAGAAIVAGLLPNLTACGDEASGLPRYDWTGPLGPESTFELGVASGDALADAIVLWTHVSPGFDVGPVDIWVEVAVDPGFARRVVARSVPVDQSTDYALKVDVDGLEAGRTYYYRFFALGVESPTGRMRTLPLGPVEELRLAVASCSNYGYGYFHAYRRIAERTDLDGVIFLGDYIYEYAQGFYPFGNEIVRETAPAGKCVDLDGYRARYRKYRSDPDLQAAHRQHGWFVVWDDHELINDATSDGTDLLSHNPATDGDYFERIAAAKQAYHEYMPIRGGAADSIYRSVRFGDLAELRLLDTRGEVRSGAIGDVALDTPERTMLGPSQEAWLDAELAAGQATWQILGQQVPVAHYTYDEVEHRPVFFDQWDGYPAARQRLYDSLGRHGRGNAVVLTGDLHGACVFDLPRDPWSGYVAATGEGSLAVEFICTSVTSPYIPFVPVTTEEEQLARACPHLAWTNLVAKGYSVVTVTTEYVQNDFYAVEDVRSPSGGAERYLAGYLVPFGSTHALRAMAPAPAAEAPASLAP
jgi:alkaline phosphatase D